MMNRRRNSNLVCDTEWNYCLIFTVRNSSCGKVMFSQACVKNSVDRGGMHGRGVCVTEGGIHGRGMHGRGRAWQGGMCGKGGYMAGDTATEAGGTHPMECILVNNDTALVNEAVHHKAVFIQVWDSMRFCV